MTMNSDAAGNTGGNDGGELEKRVTAVEHRLGIIAKTMVTAEAFQREIGALRGELAGLRDELHVGLAAVRDELHTGLAAVRDQLRNEIAAVRDQLHTGLAAMRDQLRNEIAAMRDQQRDETVAARAETSALREEIRVEIAKIPFETVKWLTALAGIAAAVATTVYNIWFR